VTLAALSVYGLRIAGFLLGLHFYHEDEGDLFLRNFGWTSTE
jgi:hypothetical protein